MKNKETTSEGFHRIFKKTDYREFDFVSFKIGVEWQQENSNTNALEFEIKALKSLIQDMDATVKSKYSEEDMIKFVSFVGKNYIKAKGFYYVKGDFEKSIKVSIQHILKQFKNK